MTTQYPVVWPPSSDQQQYYSCDWHLELVEPPSSEPLDAAIVLSDHLRSPNGTVDLDYVTQLVRAARRMAERVTRRSLKTQTWDFVADRFPGGQCPIVLPRPPVQSVTSVIYIDTDGNEQTWSGSPLPYEVSAPSGPFAGAARIKPVYGTIWPIARFQMDAVRIRFVAGYPDSGSPARSDIPEDLLHGMQLVIGEFYKQRSESVHAPNQNPALIRAHDLWAPYRVP